MDIITAISPALDAIRSAFAPYYLHIKFFHDDPRDRHRDRRRAWRRD
jgi:hypothetical protein